MTIAKEIDGDGNPPRADKGWSVETDLDVEWARRRNELRRSVMGGVDRVGEPRPSPIGWRHAGHTMSEIYRLSASDFHDITTGSTTDGAGSSFTSSVGFDQTTGRGTPIANLLVNDLIHSEYLHPPPRPIVLGGIVATGTTLASKALVANVTPKPTSTTASRVVRIAGFANSPVITRIAHGARATTLRAADAADGVLDALFGVHGRLS